MLDASVRYLKGVGPAMAKKLSKLGIITISDLLHYYPSSYQDRTNPQRFSELTDGQNCLIYGKVIVSGIVETKSNLAIFKSAITDGYSYVWVNVFRYVSPYKKFNVFQNYQRDFQKGAEVYVWGTVEKKLGETNILVKEYELADRNPLHTKRVVPIYSLTEGISQKWLRELMYLATQKYADNISEIFPKNFGDFLSRKDAIINIHFPSDFSVLEKARKTLVFDEFLTFYATIQFSKRFYGTQNKSRSYVIKKNLLTPFKNNLNFEFTPSQKKVINEIFTDMLSPKPANRVIIGDVGCGKTVVAVAAMLLAVENNYQAVLMAPTEILARQHFETIKKYVGNMDVNIELLVSGIPKKRYETLIKKIAEGHSNIIVGTHALLEEKVNFLRVGLFVIDEQHRFGVNQRLKLREKSPDADVLLMSATPIPRTLALTMYGDMDVSYIKDMPPNRVPVKTYFMSDIEAYKFVEKQLQLGNQAFIVYPLVDTSEKLELKSAITEAENLSKNFFSKYKVGLIHGKMKSSQKQKVMDEFRSGKINVLIATIVIEVGIDIPTATVLVVEHAERFGLATLHQLRGRVARSTSQSYCILVGDPKTDEAKERIKVLLKTSDGFEVAKADLKLRGAGEIIGTYQHGELNFKIGDFEKDSDLIEPSRNLAKKILSEDPYLYRYKQLKNEISRRYSGKLFLSQTG